MTTAERDKVRLFGLLKMLETPRHASRLAQNCPTQAKKLTGPPASEFRQMKNRRTPNCRRTSEGAIYFRFDSVAKHRSVGHDVRSEARYYFSVSAYEELLEIPEYLRWRSGLDTKVAKVFA